LKEVRARTTDPLVSEHHGRIVKLMGDGAIVAFENVVDAVTCAVAVQDAAAARNAKLPETEHFVFRISISLGDVASVDGDVWAPA
jgi:class 3 adenylate cyclase